MFVYMKCSNDVYEIPLAVADTAKELAEILGTTEAVVYSSISHKRKGWYKVEVEEEWQDIAVKCEARFKKQSKQISKLEEDNRKLKEEIRDLKKLIKKVRKESEAFYRE